VRAVTAARLHKDGQVGQTLHEHLTADVVQVHAFANVSASVLDGGVTVHVGQQSETHSLVVLGGIGEAVNDHPTVLSVKHFAHSRAEFIVGNRAPFWSLLI